MRRSISISDSLPIDLPCDEALQLTKRLLVNAGLRPVQTFDLNAARSLQHVCSCPNHGTDDCDCQMVVLLVYGKQGDPATLVIHGQDGRSWVSLAGPVGKRFNQHLEVVVRRALIPHVSNMPSSVEATYEARPTL